MFTEQLTQALAIPAAALPPVNYASNVATNASGWIVGPMDMGRIRRAFGVINVGVIAGGGTGVTASFLAANSSNTTNTGLWSAVTSGPTQLINANTMGTIEMRADQMPAGTRYLCLLVNNPCAAIFGAELFGGESAYDPANQYNINTTYLNQNVM